jgi:superfamily II DNA/RNA helicase
MQRAALRQLVGREDVRNGIVFCNRKSEVDVVAKSLKQHGFDAAPIHGDLDQSLRTKTLAAFRSGELKLLVASDVAARGLDIPDVSHVFNYDVSHHADDYVHRIGRTGRAGKLGQTFMIVTPGDDKSLDKVLKLIKMDPQELKLDLSGDMSGRSAPVRSDTPAANASEAPTRSQGRSRKTTTEVAPESPATEAVPIETAPARNGSAQPADSVKAPRSRARRATKAVVTPERETAEMPAVEVQPESPPAATAVAAERPRAEPQLRQADRRPGGRDDRDQAPAREGLGFGSDIPAFLRRAPTRQR